VKSRGEVEVKILPKSLKTAAPRHSPAARLREEYVLVEDYGRRIKTAREAKGLSQEDLAKLLNEKLSLIKKVEGEKVTPPPLLIRKLEHLLKVKLLEHAKEVEEVSPPRETTAMKRPSLGDVAVFKDGEKGE
jgi:putative transcription factor